MSLKYIMLAQALRVGDRNPGPLLERNLDPILPSWPHVCSLSAHTWGLIIKHSVMGINCISWNARGAVPGCISRHYGGLALTSLGWELQELWMGESFVASFLLPCNAIHGSRTLHQQTSLGLCPPLVSKGLNLLIWQVQYFP